MVPLVALHVSFFQGVPTKGTETHPQINRHSDWSVSVRASSLGSPGPGGGRKGRQQLQAVAASAARAAARGLHPRGLLLGMRGRWGGGAKAWGGRGLKEVAPKLDSATRWPWLSKPMGSHFGGFGAPPILVLSGDWDVHWGHDLDFDPWPHGMKVTSSPGFGMKKETSRGVGGRGGGGMAHSGRKAGRTASVCLEILHL